MGSERRLHPLSFIFAIQESAKQLLVPIVFGLFAARSAEAWEFYAAFAVIPIAIASFVRTFSVRYRFDETELVIRSGFFFKRVRHIPYRRIQNVDAVQNPLHQLFRVMEVRVETGGGIGSEAALRVVNAAALEEIREAVFAHRTAASAAADEAGVAATPAPVAGEVLLAMTGRDLGLFGLIHSYGMLVAGALLGLLVEVGLVDRAASVFFGDSGAGRGVLRELARAMFEDGPLPVRQLVTGVVTLVVLLTAFRILSAVWMAITYWGFRLTRSGDDLRCEYGLLTRVVSTIPVKRIQKLAVREGPWHRLAERVSLQVQTAGGKVGAAASAESTRTWLAPLVRRGELRPLVEKILPELAEDVDWQPVHPRAVRREFVGMMIVVVPIFAAAAWAFGLRALIVLPLLLAWALFYARRTVAALKWGVSDDAVHFASGWIWRNVLSAPLAKVQAVSRHEGPLDRRHGMASVAADTAGGTWGGSAIHVPYLAAPVATDLADRLSTAAARTEFRW